MDYVYTLIIIIGLYVILSSSFNLIIGYGGLISIAHPIFYAIGAYGSAGWRATTACRCRWRWRQGH